MELIPALRSLGIGLVPYSPLHTGLLAGVLEAVAEGGISDESTLQRIEAHRDQLEAYEGLCRELGAKPADVALAWLLHNPSSAIVGALTIDELQADLGACRCSWTPRPRNDSTRSGLDQGKPRRRTPGKADPRYLARGAYGTHDDVNRCQTSTDTETAVSALCLVRWRIDRLLAVVCWHALEA